METNTTHGHAKISQITATYAVWRTMRQRCNNPNSGSYAWYGGRGIKVCERWDDYANFLADMGECPRGMSLDRTDNDGPYSPGNCNWVARKIQARNTRRNRFVIFQGKSITLAEAAEVTGLPYKVIQDRIVRYKWPVERALTERVRQW